MSTLLQAACVVKKTNPWTRDNTIWMLGLYGTAVGAGTLFLPITAGMGGFWPLVFMAVLALPMTFFAHRALCRFVFSGAAKEGDLTEVAEEHFNLAWGKIITWLYFFAIYPILLLYSVAITNTVQSFIVNQLGRQAPPRALTAILLILLLITAVYFGERITVKVMSLLVYPFVVSLILLALYLIPYWNPAFFTQAGSLSHALGTSAFYKTLWLSIPVMVFAFNHSPIISSFAVHEKNKGEKQAEQNASRVLLRSHLMMVFSVLFFVFSCVFSLSPADLAQAKLQNVSILSYLANHFHVPLIEWLAPLIAFLAIFKSFLGHYLGAREGFNGIMIKRLRKQGKKIERHTLNKITAVFMVLTTWLVATLNPSILGMIEMLCGPVIALLLFVMPVYAVYKVPAMKRYMNDRSNGFVFVMGMIALSAILYGLC
ncbi:MAG: HAAAP family serine/threonine permease [Gammaproteobacteria bacterium]|nr:HAAAP family serine/threonine permease [Gammaproteobacteria bacterium]